MRRQTTGWEKLFAKGIFDKRPLSKIGQEYLKLNNIFYLSFFYNNILGNTIYNKNERKPININAIVWEKGMTVLSDRSKHWQLIKILAQSWGPESQQVLNGM